VTYRRYRSRPPWRRALTFVALLLAAVAAAAAARADEPGGVHGPYFPARIAEGVTIGETQVGGMTAEQAATAIHADFRRPIPVGLPGRTFYASPGAAGGVPLVVPAVTQAFAAEPGEHVGLKVLVDRPRLSAASARFADRLTRPAVDAKVRLEGLRPVVSRERFGVEVEASPLAHALRKALRTGSREPVDVSHSTLVPDVMAKDLRTVVVIQRSANRLLLYEGNRKPSKLGVATGQPIYPTPLGQFTIVDKQLNPWWYPPDSPWAAGATPIPPGPGNPLGTRWMGLSSPGVGIHGTPDAASIGYSASHGCIRMRIPEAEWLYERVSIGTPVFIVP
jgi:lipoprotein-anchoring transpeptidase ErfK/SrfK